jgi:hypothetical protein
VHGKIAPEFARWRIHTVFLFRARFSFYAKKKKVPPEGL